MFSSSPTGPAINFAFMKAGEKLKRTLKEVGMEPTSFAKLLGAKNPSQDAQNWLKRGLPFKYSWKAERLLGRNGEWLCHDDDDLEPGISEAVRDQADRAMNLFGHLTESQADLVVRLIQEIARK